MNDLNVELKQLLHEEREAALRADLDSLQEVQERKRQLLDQVAREEDSPSVDPALASMARANLTLMRRLVGLQRALSGVDAPGYDAGGKAAPGAQPRTARGSL